jgi:hypothetical protein
MPFSDIKESGQSGIVGDEFLAITVGRTKNRVRYLVIRTWPNSSTGSERIKDKRLIFGDEGSRLILTPQGYQPLDTTGMAYLLRGSTWDAMKLNMKEFEVPMLHSGGYRNCGEIWAFLMRYAHKKADFRKS